ncbi:uncharacterized protein LOC132917696 isoform X1 [Rhopalosiphum padi]|uniref:uncharacterized protein LOC132917696 isoform X1 n=1 Tax=Rhopalosiphum padi TaxID=40932 RepID=UPI00298DACBA|nr:uncharacterized protein LOC132917696 isoform X1 [Rhopalosiphum padi]
MKVDSYIIFKSFSVPYYYSIPFGWMPIHIPKNDSEMIINKSLWSIPGLIFSLCYIILLIVSGSTTRELRNAIKYQGNRTLSNLTIHDRIQIVVGPMFIISLWLNQTIIIIIYILMPFHLKGLRKVFELFNTFFKCHGSIIGDKNTINMIARNTNIESIMMIIMNTVLSIVSVTTSFNRIRLSFAWKLFIMIDNVIHKLEALSLCIQFWCMCSMLAKCFKCLNVSLDRLRVRKNQVTIRPPGLFTMSDRLTLPTNMVMHLRKLNRAHTDLCFILDRINDVYQVLILLSIITCILNMLPHLFVLGIIMAYSNFRITPQISMVIWPLHYMIRVYILCKAASLASNEARRTKTILNTAFDKRLTDDEKKGIKRFLERIDNKKIRFSLYGLSYLDDEYFLSSVMAVGGYLVIIIQSYMTVIEEQYPIYDRPTADKFDE